MVYKIIKLISQFVLYIFDKNGNLEGFFKLFQITQLNNIILAAILRM